MPMQTAQCPPEKSRPRWRQYNCRACSGHSTTRQTSKVKLCKSAVERVLFYGLEAIAMTTSRCRKQDQARRAPARFSLGIHFSDDLRNEELARKSFGNAGEELAAQWRRLLAVTSSSDAALWIVMNNPPKERQRYVMGRLRTL